MELLSYSLHCTSTALVLKHSLYSFDTVTAKDMSKLSLLLALNCLALAAGDRACVYLGTHLRVDGTNYSTSKSYGPHISAEAASKDCSEMCRSDAACSAAHFKHHYLWSTCWRYEGRAYQPLLVGEDTGFPDRSWLCAEEADVASQKASLASQGKIRNGGRGTGGIGGPFGSVSNAYDKLMDWYRRP